MPTTPNDSPSDYPLDPSQPPLEMAYVLFMDIVSYSRMYTDTQPQVVRRLQNVVRDTPEFQRAISQKRLIGLPTGDGMALAFFGDPQSPVQCAVEASLALKDIPEILVRMGMHAGPVYRTIDIAGKENVAGDGINMAQRVMDCGDAGHILVSKSLAEVLRQLSGFTGALSDLGETSVKHGVRVHVFNFVNAGVGNPALPKKFQRRSLGRSQRWMLAAALFLLIACAVVTFVFRTVLFPRMFRKPTVAVLGFNNMRQDPDTQWAATSMEEMLTTELGAGDNLRTIPGETVAKAKVEMALPEGVTFGQDTLDRLHRRLKCDYVLYGSMDDPGTKMGGRVRLDVHLQDVSTGEMVSITESDSELKLNGLASRIGASLRTRLNLPAITAADSKRVDAAVPANQQASKSYFEGLRQLRSFDLLAARDSFQNSIAEDSVFPLSHAYLAEVWSKLGYDDHSKSEAKIAFDLSSNLLREDQLLIKARYFDSISEWDKAVDLYRSLWNFSQDDTEYALRAADVQVRAGKATDALATLADLRNKAPNSADDPRIDLREAEAYESLGDSRKAAEAAKRAADKAHATGARLLEAEALWRVCGGLTDIGDVSSATRACSRSIDLARATGDQLLVARALTNLGHIQESQGDSQQGLQLHRQALEIARKLGSQRDVAGALTNIGRALSDQGDHVLAAKSYREGLQVATEINDRSAILDLQNNIAVEIESTGDFAAALDFYQRSLNAALLSNDETGQADAKSNVAALQLLRGDLLSAEKNAKEALQLSQQLGLQTKTAVIQTIQGDILLAGGHLDAAEKTYREALVASQKLDDKVGIAQAQLSLGNLDLAKGDWPAAEGLGRDAAAGFRSIGNHDMETSAQLTLASALIGEKRLPDAQVALLAAQSLKSGDPTVRLAAELVSARILACTGRLMGAQQQASDAVTRSKKMSLLQFELRGGLVIGEFGLCGASRQASRAQLHSLELTAAAKGYHLIERQAGEMSAQLP